MTGAADRHLQVARPGGRVDLEAAERATRALLVALGADPDDGGLRDTPRRVAAAFAELLTPVPFAPTSFPNDEGYDELVVARSIPFASLCQHHLLPFCGVAHVGYLPGERILGLSKLARVVELFARDLQTQERLTSQIARFLQHRLAPGRAAAPWPGACSRTWSPWARPSAAASRPAPSGCRPRSPSGSRSGATPTWSTPAGSAAPWPATPCRWRPCATLEHVLTDQAFEVMIALAGRFTAGVQEVLEACQVPWSVVQLGARAEYRFCAPAPVGGGQSAAAGDDELDDYLHLYLHNRGVLLTPFHNMALMCPATTEADVDRHSAVFGAAVAELVGR